MLSLIKAHCFRIKGDWYLVFPHGELAASWFLPAALLKWYIRLEIGLGLLSAVFVILALQSATIGNPAALVAAFLAVVVLVGRYLGVPYFFHHLGGVPAPYTFESLKMRGYTVLGGRQYHFPTHVLLVFLFLLTVLASWLFLKFLDGWISQSLVALEDLGATAVIVGGMWLLVRYQTASVRYLSTADIDPPPQ